MPTIVAYDEYEGGEANLYARSGIWQPLRATVDTDLTHFRESAVRAIKSRSHLHSEEDGDWRAPAASRFEK